MSRSLNPRYYQGSQDAISSDAWVAGGTRRLVGDIIRAVTQKSFVVSTDEGQSRCQLVERITGPGQMTITATHAAQGMFNVVRMSSRYVWRADGQKFRWVVGSANATGDIVGIVAP
jgi:hypothetical protein